MQVELGCGGEWQDLEVRSNKKVRDTRSQEVQSQSYNRGKETNIEGDSQTDDLYSMNWRWMNRAKTIIDSKHCLECDASLLTIEC